MNYTSISEQQREEMLEAIGVDNIEALFEIIPAASRMTGELDLPPAASELELQREIAELTEQNRGTHELSCFMGGGAYDHFVPAFIDQMISRGEFLTAYTPYQGEASQGSLQAFFEFQSQIARVTGMDIANASLYEGASAAGEAVLLSLNMTGKRRVLVASSVHPHTRDVISTMISDLAAEYVEVEAGEDGVVSPEHVTAMCDDDTACLVLQSPNVFGLIENWSACFDAMRSACDSGKKPLAIASCNPIACALLKNPGDSGADIAVGEGQPLGIPLQLGGPYVGLFAAKKDFTRKMPGRLVGMSEDAEGRRAFTLTLQTREQHIRGAKATSNICTNQGLLALRATMYMTAMGPQGLREVAEQCWHKAHDLAKQIDALDGFSLKYPGHFFHEFVVECPVPARVIIDQAKEHGFLAGIDLSHDRIGNIGSDRDLLVSVTEKRTKDELDRFARALAEITRSA